MHARSGRLQVGTDRVDDSVQAIRDTIPEYREQNGYKGFTILVNRESGEVLGISFWESEADRDASEDLGRRAREAAAQNVGGAEPVREAWEVAFDDMA
jgi:heme-degrading monooxygenase HmoA